jgi:hypothetical protein
VSWEAVQAAELPASTPPVRGAGGNGAAGREPSVASYFDAFAPAPAWDELVAWPPDVFALTNLVLDHTEGYRFVVAPPPGRRWPELPDWGEQVRLAARAWGDAAGAGGGELPSLVRRLWATVTRCRDVPLAEIRSGAAWELAEALLTLHATADEACAGVASSGRTASPASLEGAAWALLQDGGSLSRLSPARVRIVPKTHFAALGITIRSLSRYLALCYESVDVRWRSIAPAPPSDRRDYNIVLVPWPLIVGACDFRPALPKVIENMDLERFGFFEFAPEAAVDRGLLGSLLAAAVEETGRVDAVIFPEDAVHADEIAGLEETLDEHGATFLIAGVREPPTARGFGRNYLHFGVRGATGWDRYEQDKHHRWCLDEGQLRQYRLTRLLDGPQLAGRWPCRYAASWPTSPARPS